MTAQQNPKKQIKVRYKAVCISPNDKINNQIKDIDPATPLKIYIGRTRPVKDMRSQRQAISLQILFHPGVDSSLIRAQKEPRN